MLSDFIVLLLILSAGDQPKEGAEKVPIETNKKIDFDEAKKNAGKIAALVILENQAEAWNKGDLPGFMKWYLESDELTFFSGNAKTKGWKSTLERYQKKYQGEGKEMGKLSFKEVTVELLGDDHALVRGRFQLELKKESPTGIFTLIMRNTPAGWRIIHDHTSS